MRPARLKCKSKAVCMGQATNDVNGKQARRLLAVGYTYPEVEALLPLCQKCITKLVKEKRKHMWDD